MNSRARFAKKEARRFPANTFNHDKPRFPRAIAIIVCIFLLILREYLFQIHGE